MITILSRSDAVKAISKDPNRPIIAIGETNSDAVEAITSIAKNCLCLRFDDITTAHPAYDKRRATKEQIEEAINWGKNKKDLIVACRAGISRSSAIAYLIECVITNPENAIKNLDYLKHQPNLHIINLGSRTLKNESIENTFDEWMKAFYQRYL